MNIKQGYKQTEIGIIPEDWEMKKLIDISQLITKGTTPKKFSETGINFIKIECFEGNLINQEKCAFIDIITHSTELKRSILQEGDILFAIAGATIGKCNVVQSEILPANTNQALAIVRLKQNENREFVYRLLASYKMQKYITDNVSVGAQPNLNLEQIGNFLFAYPLFSEQTAIATALSDIDALIGELDKLIAKKQGIKHATMQQLLTGKKRLSGFGSTSKYKQTEIGVIPEDWEVKPLNEITSLMTNGFVGISKSHYTDFDNGVIYIQGFNVEENSFNFTGIKKVTEEFHKRHSKSCLQEGDLLTIQTGDVGLTTIVPKELAGSNCHALIITRFKKGKFEPKFFSYYFNSWKGKKQLKEIETGTTMKHINVGHMIDVQIPIPPLKEQTAIANILSDMDSEISQLEGRRAKMGELKQGMMQELLTGRIRLI